jgi:hypothetical protein
MNGKMRPTLHHKVSNHYWRILQQMMGLAERSGSAEIRGAVAQVLAEIKASSISKSGDYQVLLDSIPYNLELGPNAGAISEEFQVGAAFDPSTMPAPPPLLRQLTPVSARLEGIKNLIAKGDLTAEEWERMAALLREARLAHGVERKESDQIGIMHRSEQWRLPSADSPEFVKATLGATATGLAGEEAHGALRVLAARQKQERQDRTRREKLTVEREAAERTERAELETWLRKAVPRGPLLARKYAAELAALKIKSDKKAKGRVQAPSESTFVYNLRRLASLTGVRLALDERKGSDGGGRLGPPAGPPPAVGVSLLGAPALVLPPAPAPQESPGPPPLLRGAGHGAPLPPRPGGPPPMRGGPPPAMPPPLRGLGRGSPLAPGPGGRGRGGW